MSFAAALLLTLAPAQAEDAAAELHPIAATVKKSLEQGGMKADRPFTLIVDVNCDDAKGAIAAYRGAAEKTRAEEGNMQYDLHRSATEPSKFLLIERWKSVDALDQHLKADYTAEYVGFLEANATIELRVMRPVPKKAPKRKAK